jgi:acetoacetate decarboxylase
MSEPVTRPAEISGWPKLVLRYETDPEALAALLPPGLEPCGAPSVQIGIYCVPVHDEPELGVSTKIAARYDGTDGWYSLGMGIDQEAAIFVSRETNGQPKFPCSVRYFRNGSRVEASCTHQGRTFLTYSGTASGSVALTGEETHEDEWWIKVSRAVGGAEGAYDFAPHVVQVHSSGIATHVEALDGELHLHDSPWDPYVERLPMRGDATAQLVTTRHTGRAITLRGALDPVGFWPFADTIGGSRWLGNRGGPGPSRSGG